MNNIRWNKFYWHNQLKLRVLTIEHANVGEGWSCYDPQNNLVFAKYEELEELPDSNTDAAGWAAM